MHKYIDQIIGVNCDSNWEYCVVSNLGEEILTFVCQHLIKQLMTHNEYYTRLNEKKTTLKFMML